MDLLQKGSIMKKKEYMAPKMKEIKLKSRANLLCGSGCGEEIGGELNYNDYEPVDRKNV